MIAKHLAATTTTTLLVAIPMIAILGAVAVSARSHEPSSVQSMVAPELAPEVILGAPLTLDDAFLGRVLDPHHSYQLDLGTLAMPHLHRR